MSITLARVLTACVLVPAGAAPPQEPPYELWPGDCDDAAATLVKDGKLGSMR